MILEAFFDLLFGFLEGIVGMLPDASDLGLSNTGSVSGLMATLRGFDTVLPIHEVVEAMGLLLTIYGAVFAYRVAKELRTWLPFV